MTLESWPGRRESTRRRRYWSRGDCGDALGPGPEATGLEGLAGGLGELGELLPDRPRDGSRGVTARRQVVEPESEIDVIGLGGRLGQQQQELAHVVAEGLLLVRREHVNQRAILPAVRFQDAVAGDRLAGQRLALFTLLGLGVGDVEGQQKFDPLEVVVELPLRGGGLEPGQADDPDAGRHLHPQDDQGGDGPDGDGAHEPRMPAHPFICPLPPRGVGRVRQGPMIELTLEVLPELACAAVSPRRVGLEAMADDRLEAWRDGRVPASDVHRPPPRLGPLANRPPARRGDGRNGCRPVNSSWSTRPKL